MKVKIAPGVNDLATTHPNIAKEWHPTKNGDFSPEQTTRNSNKRVWWKCEKGHEYDSIIHNRVVCASGCPYCSGRIAIPGQTDLLTLYPNIAKEWHPTKNDTPSAEGISPNSTTMVWWKCQKGHEWEQQVRLRLTPRSCCPTCKSKGRIGEEKLMCNGMKAKIIEYRNSKDIDVEFEDSYVATHVTYGVFTEGLIRNPNISKKGKQKPRKNKSGEDRRVGETVMTKYGKATLYKYYSVANCTVLFEDGTLVENVHYSQFRKGFVKNPNYWIGKTNISTKGQKMTIVAYKNCYNVDVQFDDGTIVPYRTIEAFRKGTIRNPNK